jgi:hypothetical protein
LSTDQSVSMEFGSGGFGPDPNSNQRLNSKGSNCQSGI